MRQFYTLPTAAPAALHTIVDREAFERSVEAFNMLYARHIAREGAEVLPTAQQRLHPDKLRELGRRMVARRGLSR